MKTELEKAEILFDRYFNEKDYPKRKMYFGECYGHLQTCKRWLEFNKDLVDWETDCIELDNKISDLQETIKFYEEKGIQ